MLNYIRNQEASLLPGMPDEFRNPSGWLQGELGLNSLGGDETTTDVAPRNLRPVSSLMDQPSLEEAQSVWLSSNYHRKGLLPLNNALVAGFDMRHKMFNDKVQFDVRPLVGQNWHSTNNYWGTEVAISLHSTSSLGQTDKTWGRIALRYDNGNFDTMGHSRGYDLHGELNFNDHLGLNIGATQNEQTELGNYAILRWKLIGD